MNPPADQIKILQEDSGFDVQSHSFLFNLGHPIVVLNEDGYILWANQRWVDSDISDQLPVGQNGLGLHFGRDVLPQAHSLLNELKGSNKPQTLDIFSNSKNTWWRLSASANDNLITIFFVPITDLHQDDKLLNALPYGVVHTDQDGVILSSNTNYAKMRDGSHDIGQNLWSILDRVNDWRAPKGAESSGPSEIYLPYSTTGTWVEVQTKPLIQNSSLVGHVASFIDIEDRRELRQQAEKSWVDELTGLANRRGLERALEEIYEVREGTLGRGLALMIIDINDFKKINDTFGHIAGDDAIKAVAERLRLAIRPTDTAARLGGDEFAVLLPYATEEDALQVAKRLSTIMSRKLSHNGGQFSISASIGVTISGDHVDLVDLISSADKAMYEAKEKKLGTSVNTLK